MENIELKNGRCYFKPFNSQNDINLTTGKSGIAAYSSKKNKFLHFIMSFFNLSVSFSVISPEIYFNKRSLKKWLVHHGESKALKDISSKIHNIINRNFPINPSSSPTNPVSPSHSNPHQTTGTIPLLPSFSSPTFPNPITTPIQSVPLEFPVRQDHLPIPDSNSAPLPSVSDRSSNKLSAELIRNLNTEQLTEAEFRKIFFTRENLAYIKLLSKEQLESFKYFPVDYFYYLSDEQFGNMNVKFFDYDKIERLNYHSEKISDKQIIDFDFNKITSSSFVNLFCPGNDIVRKRRLQLIAPEYLAKFEDHISFADLSDVQIEYFSQNNFGNQLLLNYEKEQRAKNQLKKITDDQIGTLNTSQLSREEFDIVFDTVNSENRIPLLTIEQINGCLQHFQKLHLNYLPINKIPHLNTSLLSVTQVVVLFSNKEKIQLLSNIQLENCFAHIGITEYSFLLDSQINYLLSKNLSFSQKHFLENEQNQRIEQFLSGITNSQISSLDTSTFTNKHFSIVFSGSPAYLDRIKLLTIKQIQELLKYFESYHIEKLSIPQIQLMDVAKLDWMDFTKLFILNINNKFNLNLKSLTIKQILCCLRHFGSYTYRYLTDEQIKELVKEIPVMYKDILENEINRRNNFRAQQQSSHQNHNQNNVPPRQEPPRQEPPRQEPPRQQHSRQLPREYSKVQIPTDFVIPHAETPLHDWYQNFLIAQKDNNFAKLFELTKNYTEKDVVKAFRKFALILHPDKNVKEDGDAATSMFQLFSDIKKLLIEGATKL